MRRFSVKSEKFSYPVIVGRGAWQSMGEVGLEAYSSVFVLTEHRLWTLWGKRFMSASGLQKAQVLEVPSGERSKSLARFDRVIADLARHGADRHSLLVLFGGGVIGDLGGFVASTYMRGVDCVQVPTTVVAQVDSAVGGKTAINVGETKNLVGTFYPPRLVLADPAVLSTLDRRTLRSGLYEVVKHAILCGSPLFDDLESGIRELGPGSTEQLEPIIGAAVKVKIDIVSRDERESRLRQVLNLGHTLGHALEEATGYRRFLHGEAVGWGLIAVTRLAERLGMLPVGDGTRSDAARIMGLVRAVGSLPSIRDLATTRMMRLLPRDKKTVGGRVHWVMPERIGKVRITPDVDPSAVAATFNELKKLSH